MSLGCDTFIGDPFGQPVPPRLQSLFRAARSAPGVLKQLRGRKNIQSIVRYVLGITPAAICPLCVGEGCYTCEASGWYSLAQFEQLPEDRMRQIKRFL